MPSSYRVAINGFGRIGRLYLRSHLESRPDGVEIVAINDSSPPSTASHLLKYDSVHGALGRDVEVKDDRLIIDGKSIRFTSQREHRQIDWSELDVDLVVECTGRFTDRAAAAGHLTSVDRPRGAKKVLISAPGNNADATVVYGVNHQTLSAAHTIISSASCTTNCLAPVASVLHTEIGILRGYMTTVHAYTVDQRAVDGSHTDLRRARAAAQSAIPSTTGAAKALGLVIPDLAGKLGGSAVRIPVPNVSMVDLTFDAARDVTADEINGLMKDAAQGSLRGVLEYCDEPLVSIDFNHNPSSAVFDSSGTQVIDGRFVRVLAWYDNEWGFSNRLVDVASHLATL